MEKHHINKKENWAKHLFHSDHVTCSNHLDVSMLFYHVNARTYHSVTDGVDYVIMSLAVVYTTFLSGIFVD